MVVVRVKLSIQFYVAIFLLTHSQNTVKIHDRTSNQTRWSCQNPWILLENNIIVHIKWNSLSSLTWKNINIKRFRKNTLKEIESICLYNSFFFIVLANHWMKHLQEWVEKDTFNISWWNSDTVSFGDVSHHILVGSRGLNGDDALH